MEHPNGGAIVGAPMADPLLHRAGYLVPRAIVEQLLSSEVDWLGTAMVRLGKGSPRMTELDLVIPGCDTV